MRWEHRAYGSGTEIVTQSLPYRPHYYVYADHRSKVCAELAVWLNEGIRPDWADTLHRDGPDAESCTGDFGISISATGPAAFQGYSPDGPDKLARAAPLRIELIERLFE